ERMAAGLAQEELERVRRRLVRERGEDARRRLGLRLQNLDAAGLELAEDGVGLERIELHRLDDVGQVRVANEAGDLRGLEQLVELLANGEGLELDRHHVPPLVTRHHRPSKRVSPAPGRVIVELAEVRLSIA